MKLHTIPTRILFITLYNNAQSHTHNQNGKGGRLQEMQCMIYSYCMPTTLSHTTSNHNQIGDVIVDSGILSIKSPVHSSFSIIFLKCPTDDYSLLLSCVIITYYILVVYYYETSHIGLASTSTLVKKWCLLGCAIFIIIISNNIYIFFYYIFYY